MSYVLRAPKQPESGASFDDPNVCAFGELEPHKDVFEFVPRAGHNVPEGLFLCGSDGMYLRLNGVVCGRPDPSVPVRRTQSSVVEHQEPGTRVCRSPDGHPLVRTKNGWELLTVPSDDEGDEWEMLESLVRQGIALLAQRDAQQAKHREVERKVLAELKSSEKGPLAIFERIDPEGFEAFSEMWIDPEAKVIARESYILFQNVVRKMLRQGDIEQRYYVRSPVGDHAVLGSYVTYEEIPRFIRDVEVGLKNIEVIYRLPATE